MWVLEMADVAMPLWSLIVIGLIALGMVVFGSIPIALTVGHRLKQTRIRSPIYMNSGIISTAPIAEKDLSAEVKLGKLGLVVKAIIEAQQITPKNSDTTVYITETNGLKQMFSQELKDILDKLQDEGKLKLKTFPEWLLPESGFSQKTHEDRMRAIFDPSRNHFTVRLLKDLSKPDKEDSQPE